MKKTLLALFFAVGVTGAAQAQSARFGVKAGASLTNVTGKDVSGTAYKFGFNGGVMANFAVNDIFSIQPELLYSMKGSKDDTNSNNKLNLGYIDIPILAKIATGATGLFFEVGPQVGFLASAKATDGTASIDAKEYLKSVDFGYAAGVGFQVASGPLVGLRYNGGFTNLGENSNINSNGLQPTAGAVKNSAFQLYVGFLFGGK